MNQIMSFLIIIVSSLISVAFYTLLERKILGYIQTRKGPNKVGLMGIFQPFSDAMKLFSKSSFFSENMNFSISAISPALILISSIMMWPLFPFANQMLFDSKLSILSFFVISSIMVFIIMLIGWSANSKYCLIGAIRSVAQMISYEVSLFLSVFSFSILVYSFSFFSFSKFNYPPLMIILLPGSLIWLITCLAESNRSPFDFAEGESELVSGFNVEYMSGWFAMIFLAEYMSMIILSYITSILFFGLINKMEVMMFIIFSSSMFLWIRGTFPRFRYDLLMNLNWKIFLPTLISLFLFIWTMSH